MKQVHFLILILRKNSLTLIFGRVILLSPQIAPRFSRAHMTSRVYASDKGHS